MVETEKVTWSFGVPFMVAIIPAILFRLFGFVGGFLNNAKGDPPLFTIVLMVGLQVLAMVAMAVVFLIRWDYSFRKLSRQSAGRIHVFRRLLLGSSFACLLIFDILANIAAALSGSFIIAAILWMAAVPFFAGFVLGYAFSFYGLP